MKTWFEKIYGRQLPAMRLVVRSDVQVTKRVRRSKGVWSAKDAYNYIRSLKKAA